MRFPALALVVLGASLLTERCAQSQPAYSGPVEVIAHIDAQPDQIADARKALLAYGTAVRGESGQLGALTLQEMGRSSRFVLIDRWKNDQAYVASRKTAARTQFDKAVAPIERAPVDERPQLDFSFKDGLTPATSALFVLTHADVTPPQRRQTEGLLKTVAEASQVDKGMLDFDVFQQLGQLNHFTLFEGWTDLKSFRAHDREAATLEFRKSIAPLLGALYDERLYRQIN
jgi:quinol monooxygenase YgiN